MNGYFSNQKLDEYTKRIKHLLERSIFMKRLLIITLMISSMVQHLTAEIRYNLANDLLSSYPETPDINQNEYRRLVFECVQIGSRMMTINGGKLPSKIGLLNQCDFYLKGVGTQIALRLRADLENDIINYADGSFMSKIFDDSLLLPLFIQSLINS